MGATVTISSSDLTPTTAIIIKCNQVTVGFKNNNSTKPTANGDDIGEVQTISQNNPTYNLQGVMITGEAGTLTYKNILELLNIDFNGTNAPLLTITYGKGSSTTTVPKWSATPSSSTGPIPVILDAGNINFDAKDSVGGYLPTGTLTFVETRTV